MGFIFHLMILFLLLSNKCLKTACLHGPEMLSNPVGEKKESGDSFEEVSIEGRFNKTSGFNTGETLSVFF